MINIEQDELSSYSIFDKVADEFENFLTEIVIPKTVLYAQQKGHVFSTSLKETKAFFGMHIVMGIHKVSSIRDYWSSDPILQVPYIAKIMPLKRFEEHRAYVHFNDNEKMTSRDDKNHDRAFKVRLVLDHFNQCFLKTLSSTKQQSIDEHMMKYKEHSILKHYVKGKPIQWGFKF